MSTESAHTSPEALLFATAELPSASKIRPPTHRAPTQSWRSARRNSSRYPARREELLHSGGNLDNVRLDGKVPGIQELHARVRYVLSKCLRSRRNEKGIILAPNPEQWRLNLPEVVLKRRIELHVRCVIEK